MYSRATYINKLKVRDLIFIWLPDMRRKSVHVYPIPYTIVETIENVRMFKLIGWVVQ